MPRYAKDYRGERRTAPITIKVTPSERAALEVAAKQSGATLSQFGRELCVRRSTAAQIVAGTRRDPALKALVAELTAIGNNLNQLAKVANTDRTAPQLRELKATTDLLKATFVRVLAL